MSSPAITQVGSHKQLNLNEHPENWPSYELDSESGLNTACNGKCLDLSNWAVMTNLKDSWCSIKFGAFPIVGAVGSFAVTMYCTLKMILLVSQKIFYNISQSDNFSEKERKMTLLAEDLVLYRKYAMAHLTNIFTLGILFTVEGCC